MRAASASAAVVAVAVSAVVLAPSPLGSREAALTGASRLLVVVAPKQGQSGRGGGLELVDRTGRLLRLLSRAHYGIAARWSPDDKLIGWADPAGIHVAAADGSNARLLVSVNKACPNCPQLSFIWSPDSRSLTVGSAGVHGNELQLVPIDGGAPTRLVSSKDPRRVYTPGWWTPGGKSLVYGESRSVAITGAWTRLLTPASGKIVTLWSTPTAQGSHPPLISPNLRYWAYVKEIDQYHQQVRILDKMTGKTRIVTGVNSTNLVGWSPDSAAFAVIEAGWHLVTVAPNGAMLRAIGPAWTFSWGRNGELFILRSDSYRQVWDSLNGGRERLLFQVPKNQWVVSLDGN